MDGVYYGMVFAVNVLEHTIYFIIHECFTDCKEEDFDSV